MRVMKAFILVLAALVLCVGVGAAGGAAEVTPEAVRAAVTRSLPLLEKSSAEYTRKQTCFSCHHQTLPVLAIAAARGAGLQVDEANFQAQLRFTAASLQVGRDGYRQGRGQGGGVDTAGYALWALETGGWKPDEM